MSEAHPCPSLMAVGTKLCSNDSEIFKDHTLYRRTIGVLQYLTLTRPDISFIVNKLSQFLQAPIELQWQACKRVLRYLKGTQDHGLLFKLVAFLSVECYTDVDWGSNLDDRWFASGYCVYLGLNLIQWSFKKQKVVALSSIEAESRALAQTATEIAFSEQVFGAKIIS
ncbi:uncharacterized protein LOC116145926 [Pistacia vera]|uniref:uncharacterized protein LOC116145926 n=1 Tax=Pistacia vera TaxID=55513 RepID=UPI001263C0E0|nr:uncharacterized protein LOC116145926 [Pistacia vera]